MRVAEAEAADLRDESGRDVPVQVLEKVAVEDGIYGAVLERKALGEVVADGAGVEAIEEDDGWGVWLIVVIFVGEKE